MKLYRLVEQPVCFWWWFVSWMDAVPMVTEFWDVAFIYELLVRQLERCRFIRWSQCPIISTLVQRCFITFVSDVMSEFIVFNVWQCRSWRSSSVVSQHWFSSSYLLSLLVLVVTSHSLSAVAVTHFGAEFRLCFCLVSKLLVFYSNFFMLFFHDHHHDHRQPWARWCLTPLLLSLPTAAYLGHRGLTPAGLPHTTAMAGINRLTASLSLLLSPAILVTRAVSPASRPNWRPCSLHLPAPALHSMRLAAGKSVIDPHSVCVCRGQEPTVRWPLAHAGGGYVFDRSEWGLGRSHLRGGGRQR